MTALDDARTRTSSDLLYLSIDLGEAPDINTFATNAMVLAQLGRFVVDMNLANPKPGYFGHFRVVRTSLASPWVTVLGDLARTSSPIGYGAATLYGFHRVLQAVMTWQQHRLAITEQRLRLQALSEQLKAEGIRQLEEAKHSASLNPDAQPAYLQQVQTAQRHIEQSPDNPERPIGVAFTASNLGEIRAVEMISPDDPRSSGTHSEGG